MQKFGDILEGYFRVNALRNSAGRKISSKPIKNFARADGKIGKYN